MNTLHLETTLKPGELGITAEAQSPVEWAFESSPVATLFIAPDEILLRWNQRAAETLIPAHSENRPVFLRDLFVNREDVDLLLFITNQRDEPARREALLKTPDGTTIPCEVSLLPCAKKTGEPQERICFIRDLGEIKASQAEASAFQAQLKKEVEERQQAEDALQQTTVKLQEMVYEYGRRNRDTTILREMSEFLQACQSAEETYPLIARFARDLFPNTSGSLFMLQSRDDILESVSIWGEPVLAATIFAPQDCWAVRRSRIHQIAERDPLMTCRHLKDYEGPCSICIPLINQGQTIGMLHLQTVDDTGPMPDTFLSGPPDLPNEKLVATFTDHIALALSNLRLKQKLYQLAIRDGLTGLHNRRYMEESLEREIHRAKRKGTSLGILMLDIDHFKYFNDKHGHEAGDTLLKALGNYLKNSVRADDIACRYGGEEFTMILPELTLETALMRAEAIRSGIDQLRVNYRGLELEKITLSIGVALFPQNGTNWEITLREADKALYEAKESGRNRVVAARQTLPES
jgi:diguanylate cyclase (GGDEF)-like protein/PAS domain S-box-containing protein